MIRVIVYCLAIGLTCISQVVYAQGLNEFVKQGWITPKEPVTYFLEYPKQLQSLYSSNDYQRIWQNPHDRSALERQLTLIHAAGISPLFDRQLKYLRLYHARQDWFRYDLLATDALILYLQYAQYAPTKGQTWFFKRPLNIALPSLSKASVVELQRAVEHKAVSVLINQATPQSDAYKQLVDAYESLLNHQEAKVAEFRPDSALVLGQPIAHKAILVQRLAIVNVDVSAVDRSSMVVSPPLKHAIRAFQVMHGLPADGKLDKTALHWLNMSIAQRQYLLAVNAERIRLWPENASSYVQVNIPAYHMQYWYQGQVAFQSKVIVGRRSRPTPVMNTRLQTVVFNPTWNVPYRIMMDDILPKVRQDQSYLATHELEIIQSWRNPKTVAVQSIDWQRIDKAVFPYRLRQKAGPHNSLGQYKFVTPNARAIYLHDTPHKYLFSRQQRAFSSGCIRVEHAKQFAQVLMTQPGSRQEDAQQAHSQANSRVRLQQSIPVHLIYQTTWYAEGKIHYRNDIYHHDVFIDNPTPHSTLADVSTRLSK